MQKKISTISLFLEKNIVDLLGYKIVVNWNNLLQMLRKMENKIQAFMKLGVYAHQHKQMLIEYPRDVFEDIKKEIEKSKKPDKNTEDAIGRVTGRLAPDQIIEESRPDNKGEMARLIRDKKFKVSHIKYL